VVVQSLQEQQKRKVTLREEGHTNGEEIVVEAEEMPTSVTSATSGCIDPLSVLKVNKMDKEENMLLKQRKQRHCPRR